jgi:hypothetical protein
MKHVVCAICLIFTLSFLVSCAKKASPPSGTTPLSQGAQPPASKLAKEIQMGDQYYHSEQYRCYACHGMQGGQGPKLQGIAKKLGWEALMRKATHMCPPTGACPPNVLQDIGRYLQTL